MTKQKEVPEEFKELSELKKKYELEDRFFHVERHPKNPNKIMFIIITRPGIEKIQAKDDIMVEYSFPPQLQVPEKRIFVTLVKGWKRPSPENWVQTTGEAAPWNTTSVSGSYPVAVAEKRALSRVVLKLSGFYKYGVFGEDEADEFKKAITNRAQSEAATTPEMFKDDSTDEKPASRTEEVASG